LFYLNFKTAVSAGSPARSGSIQAMVNNIVMKTTNVRRGTSYLQHLYQ